MAFENLPLSKPAPRRAKNDQIFCVGWRAFVHEPPYATGAVSTMPVVDPPGVQGVDDLADGQEVEIVSWRPRSREGLLYQVRRLADGSEWWLEARRLRRHALATVAAQSSAGAPRR
jgi:hypothetical protein